MHKKNQVNYTITCLMSFNDCLVCFLDLGGFWSSVSTSVFNSCSCSSKGLEWYCTSGFTSSPDIWHELGSDLWWKAAPDLWFAYFPGGLCTFVASFERLKCTDFGLWDRTFKLRLKIGGLFGNLKSHISFIATLVWARFNKVC